MDHCVGNDIFFAIKKFKIAEFQPDNHSAEIPLERISQERNIQTFSKFACRIKLM